MTPKHQSRTGRKPVKEDLGTRASWSRAFKAAFARRGEKTDSAQAQITSAFVVGRKRRCGS